jgi:hypothetical protein
LRGRFARVNLVMFETLQFSQAEEHVVLLVAEGAGGCDSFTLWQVRDAEELADLHIFDGASAALRDDGKWTDLILPNEARQLFRKTAMKDFTRLDFYGSPELGTVTGANNFFAMSEETRREYKLDERLLVRICPPGTKHLKGLAFSRVEWERLRTAGYRVWLLCPDPKSRSNALRNYVALGEAANVHEAYKCTIRKPWWRPPVVPAPDLFFTYMSHRYPRLISNRSGATIVNSMHGIRIAGGAPTIAVDALPLLALNSITMLGAEVLGRSYGGGILKMEPREAASLPVPAAEHLVAAWSRIKDKCPTLDEALRTGEWAAVVREVDDVLLRAVMGIEVSVITQMREAAAFLRSRRTRRGRRVAAGSPASGDAAQTHG